MSNNNNKQQQQQQKTQTRIITNTSVIIMVASWTNIPSTNYHLLAAQQEPYKPLKCLILQ